MFANRQRSSLRQRTTVASEERDDVSDDDYEIPDTASVCSSADYEVQAMPLLPNLKATKKHKGSNTIRRHKSDKSIVNKESVAHRMDGNGNDIAPSAPPSDNQLDQQQSMMNQQAMTSPVLVQQPPVVLDGSGMPYQQPMMNTQASGLSAGSGPQPYSAQHFGSIGQIQPMAPIQENDGQQQPVELEIGNRGPDLDSTTGGGGLSKGKKAGGIACIVLVIVGIVLAISLAATSCCHASGLHYDPVTGAYTGGKPGTYASSDTHTATPNPLTSSRHYDPNQGNCCRTCGVLIVLLVVLLPLIIFIIVFSTTFSNINNNN